MRIIILFLTGIVIFGCNDKKETSPKEISHNVKKENHFQYQVNFPDTIYVNKSYAGEIYFESPLDTITEIFFDPKKYRYVVFTTLPHDLYTFHKDFYKDSLGEYRIGAIDNRIIPFYELYFNTTGTYKIEGLVNDLVLIQPNTKYNNDERNILLIEHNFPISFIVVVIDSTAVAPFNTK